VGEAGDADAVERGGQARDRQLVPDDLDGCGLEEEAVAQGGRAEGAGRRGEEVAAGEGQHGRKLNGVHPPGGHDDAYHVPGGRRSSDPPGPGYIQPLLRLPWRLACGSCGNPFHNVEPERPAPWSPCPATSTPVLQ